MVVYPLMQVFIALGLYLHIVPCLLPPLDFGAHVYSSCAFHPSLCACHFIRSLDTNQFFLFKNLKAVLLLKICTSQNELLASHSEIHILVLTVVLIF